MSDQRISILRAAQLDKIGEGRIACAGVVCAIASRDLDCDEPFIYVCDELTYSDTPKFVSSKAVAVISKLGGVTSHVAIVARAYNRCCIAGFANVDKIVDSEYVTIVARGNLGE